MHNQFILAQNFPFSKLSLTLLLCKARIVCSISMEKVYLHLTGKYARFVTYLKTLSQNILFARIQETCAILHSALKET